MWDLRRDSSSILDGVDLFGNQVPEQSTADKSQHQEDRPLRKAVLDQGRSQEWTDRRNGYDEERVEVDETRHVSDGSCLIDVSA